ncbi:MAG: polysaccharide pyruvyl transferase family protein [Herbinix sp.]|nr:polysaccharide pyruvyl transferase family protein [Herbinix sp.]
MKTATITYHNVYNYGALLQAYALQQAQLRMSVDNVIIDYNHETNKIYHKIKGKSLKIWIVNIIRWLEFVKDFFPIKSRCNNFENFSKNKLRLTSKYATFEELKNNPPKVDWYIAGSDQIWNVSINFKNAFFLDFGDRNVKRASYAASMGSYEVPVQFRKEMCELLNRFDVISVREAEAKIYIEDFLNKKGFVHINIDPVFLLSKEDWSEFAQPRKIGFKYILCYPLAGHPLLNETLKKLKQLTNYRTVIISTEVFTRVKGDINIKDASPEEFIYLLQNAEYVLTSSFHGTAFCTIFNKKFYSFVGNSVSSRITGLLNRLGLNDRIVRSPEDINTKEIDFTYCNTIISTEKDIAKEYLNSLFYK